MAVKRLRVLDLDDVVAPSEQYAAGGSGSTQSSGGMDVGSSRRAMGASQAAFRQFFEREIAILASIRHPNVVNFIGESCRTRARAPPLPPLATALRTAWCIMQSVLCWVVCRVGAKDGRVQIEAGCWLGAD